jgi:hypothetical protein
MTMALSIRDALLEIRRFVAEDQERGAKQQELLVQLNEVVNERAHAANEVLVSLHSLVNGVSLVLGFNPELDRLVVETETKKPASKAPAKKQKASPAAPAAPTAVAGGATSVEGLVDETIEFSDNERKVIDLLKSRWPKFTTPNQMVRGECLDSKALASPTITRLRKKNVPIESAKQARENDPTIRSDTTGWRLIAH